MKRPYYISPEFVAKVDALVSEADHACRMLWREAQPCAPKKIGPQVKLTDSQIQIAQSLYDRGINISKISRGLYRQWGYRTSDTCRAAIGVAFRRKGIEIKRGRPKKVAA